MYPHTFPPTHTQTPYTHVCMCCAVYTPAWALSWDMVSGLASGPARSRPHRHPCPALGLLCSLPVLGWGSSRATHVRLKVFSERLLLLQHRWKPCGCLILIFSLNASPSCSQDNGSLCDIVTSDARRRPCRLPNDQSGQSCHHRPLLVPPHTPSPTPSYTKQANPVQPKHRKFRWQYVPNVVAASHLLHHLNRMKHRYQRKEGFRLGSKQKHIEIFWFVSYFIKVSKICNVFEFHLSTICAGNILEIYL